jgi:outer membrane biosynthesis protein TonB
MEPSRKQRWQQLQSAFEPRFKQMLLVSLLLHLLLPILSYLPFFSQQAIEKPPVYRVNLVNKIVKNPQAGRPEATPAKKKKAVKSKPKRKAKPAVKPKPIPAKPKPKSKPIPVKPKPEVKKVKPQPVKKVTPVKKKPQPKPAVSKIQENNLQKRLEQIRAKQQKKAAEQAQKDRIADLKAAALAESSKVRSPISSAPVGMADGHGNEAGVSAIAFVQEFIQQQWNLSKYQVPGNPEAEVKLLYNAEGTLLHYKFLKKSGNTIFDESLIRAIARSRRLPQPLPESMTFEILFNLKDMLGKP